METHDAAHALARRLESEVRELEAQLARRRNALIYARKAYLAMLPPGEGEEAENQIVPVQLHPPAGARPAPPPMPARPAAAPEPEGPSLRQAIYEAIRERRGEFTVSDIIVSVVERYPDRFSAEQRASISSLVSKAEKNGAIVVVRGGKGSRAAVFVSKLSGQGAGGESKARP
jgi:hypothetical protein